MAQGPGPSGAEIAGAGTAEPALKSGISEESLRRIRRQNAPDFCGQSGQMKEADRQIPPAVDWRAVFEGKPV